MLPHAKSLFDRDVNHNQLPSGKRFNADQSPSTMISDDGLSSNKENKLSTHGDAQPKEAVKEYTCLNADIPPSLGEQQKEKTPPEAPILMNDKTKGLKKQNLAKEIKMVLDDKKAKKAEIMRLEIDLKESEARAIAQKEEHARIQRQLETKMEELQEELTQTKQKWMKQKTSSYALIKRLAVALKETRADAQKEEHARIQQQHQMETKMEVLQEEFTQTKQKWLEEKTISDALIKRLETELEESEARANAQKEDHALSQQQPWETSHSENEKCFSINSSCTII